jgi:hypothetical protein
MAFSRGSETNQTFDRHLAVAQTGHGCPERSQSPMKLSKIALCAAVAAAFSLPFTAHAAKGNKNKGAAPAFSSVDKNSDGNISKDEYIAAMKDSIGEETAKTQFASLDKNKDDKLSSEEYSAAATKKKKKNK